MISNQKVAQIRELLVGGLLSQNKIAKQTGVSRSIVGSIANGKRLIKSRDVHCSFIVPSGRYVRCPECGGMAQMPCLACYYSYGETYPTCVLVAYQKRKMPPVKRRCLKCNKIQSERNFADTVQEGHTAIRHSICWRCRACIQRADRSRIAAAGKIDKRITGECKTA